MSRFIQKGFLKPSMVRMVSLSIVFLLLIGSIISVWWAFSRPTESQETVTQVSYMHRGQFDYKVYAYPGILYGTSPTSSPATEPNPTYYARLIDSIDVSFNYSFVPQEAVTSVTAEVEIRALVQDPGQWQKEIVLVPQTTRSGNFTIDFPLNVGELRQLASNISAEIGISAASIDVTLMADVHVVAQTDSGVVEDDFLQTTKLVPGGTMLEWERGLTRSQDGSYEGLDYQHRGEFSYEIHLKENILYGPITLTSPPPPPLPPEPELPVLLPKGLTYFPKIIDSMNASFSYDFSCSPAPRQASATVEVTEVLQYPGIWSKTFVLVPRTTKIGDFTVTFPVDIDELNEFADTVRDEIGMGAAQYDVTINVEVHMVAETDFGTINEVFTQSLSANLGLSTFTWGSSLDRSRGGSITETITIPKSVWPARGGALGGLLLVVLVGFFVVWKCMRVTPMPLTAVEAEAERAKKKHKDLIVDVDELPGAKAGDMVISLSSLDEVVKAADGLLKPVLHKAEPEKHTYCVIDGLIRYEYVSRWKPRSLGGSS